jgi:hypothetical protein
LRLQLLSPIRAQPPNWNTTTPWFGGLAEIIDPAKALTAVTYQDGRAGQANDFEADLATAIVQQMFLSVSSSLHGERNQAGIEVAVTDAAYTPEEFWDRGIGIVTPHRAQRAVIVRRLQAIFPTHDRARIDAAVDTVERFQGGQRDTILISFGVGDPDLIAAEEEFLLKFERTNVAISRARTKCILLISEDLAYHLPSERETIVTAKAVKYYVSTFCQPRSRHQVAAAGGNREITVRD